MVVERRKVNGDAERRADLILPPVAATDRLRLVVGQQEVRSHERVLAEAEEVVVDAEVVVPAAARREPLVEEAWCVGRSAEVLHLHLLELARAEDEIARRDLVAK